MSLHGKLAGFGAALAFSAAIAAAQQAAGPVMGLLVDARDNSIHAILGVPGAALVGETVDAGEVTPMAVSPTGAYVLVSASSTQLPALWSPSTGLRPLPGLKPAADRVALSPAGSSAAFYYASASHMTVVSGLPDHPSAPVETDLLPLGYAVENFAVSDDGKLLLCAGQTGGAGVAVGSAAVVAAGAGEVQRVVLPGAVSALSFAAGGHDALLASGAEAMLVRHVDRPGGRIPLTAEGIEAISALAVSPDGKKAFLAGSRSGKIAILSLNGSEPPVLLDCDCRPKGFFRMNENAVYRLTEYTGSTVHLLDVTAAPRILALPPSIEPDRQQ